MTEWHFDTSPDLNAPFQFLGNDVIELPSQGYFKGDTGDVQRRTFSRERGKMQRVNINGVGTFCQPASPALTRHRELFT